MRCWQTRTPLIPAAVGAQARPKSRRPPLKIIKFCRYAHFPTY
jgi:hypothetical protein